MNYFITALMVIFFANFSQAQSKDYATLWKKVETYENDGFPKSALEIVKEISVLAIKDNNTPQQIKTLLYQSKYAMTLEEDAQLKIMADFKNAIATTKAPAKNVLENILATMYWQYFQQNRYQFYNRTNTASKVDETDFQTWDLQRLFDEIHLHYQNSLENETILKQTQLEDYNAILMEQANSKTLRPTLFDLLAHNALEFYKTDENSITQPAYKFEIDTADYLKEAKGFITLNITSKDTTSLQLNALKLYQKLIAFHLNDKEPYALVDVDIERLKYVDENATFANEDTLLLDTLKASSIAVQSHEVSALYNYEIAVVYNQQGAEYEPKTKEEHRWKLKEALEICNKVIAKYPKSRGAQMCEALKSQILRPSLEIITEDLLPLQQDALMKVTYKNLGQLQFKIYNMSRKQADKFKEIYRQEEQLAFIKTLDISTQFQSALKTESDYQSHSMEHVLPSLTNGNYLIFASKPDVSDSFFALKTIQVTDIALVNTSENSREVFQVINRLTGKPLANATIKLSYKVNYNGSTVNSNNTSDKDGRFFITKDNQRLVDLDVEVRHDNEVAYFDDFYVNQYYKSNSEQQVTYNSFLFTDRSIYRPGQVVYFKGIAMSTKDGKSEVTPNMETKVMLYNVNGEMVKEMILKTNEFGSVAGEFILPSDGLTGQFNITMRSNEDATTYFSVEEYKRPKFETKFEPVTETFKVNDSIKVKGTAMAYAGSNITDAKVVYRVTRKVNYPYWYYWSRPWFNSEPQEITHGESITNDKGEFEITFKAIPDESVDKKSLPVFQYEMTADVTDINGETRSATSIVNVGYHALTATVSINEKLDKTKKDHKLSIDTKNLNGEFVPATGTVKIYKLKAPQHVLRPRPWTAPDYRLMSKEEFHQKFPHIAYEEESNPETWDKGELVFDQNFDTSKSKELDLGTIKKWASGQYIVVLESKDKFGQIVKAEAKTTLYDDDDKTLADHQLFSVTTDKNDYKIGENVVITFGSSAENLTVTVDVEKDREVVNSFIIPLSNNKKTIAIPVLKDDLGGFAIHYSYAFANSFQSGVVTISVPYPKSDLEIETTTFRDKLQPGADETWSFKIKGPKGDKVSAELLASMYDMSLDQFQPHIWDFSPLSQSIYTSYSRLNARKSFGTSQFRMYNNLQRKTSYSYQGYDQLNWFGFYFGNNSNYYRQRYLRNANANVPSSYKSSTKSSIKEGTIEGIIIDSNNLPLPGVNVILKGSSKGTQSDFDGNFSVEAKEGSTLIISYLGLKSLEVKIEDFNYLKITLIEDNSQLDEVVVSALGIKREQKSIGYATESISNDELPEASSPIALERLKNKSSGVENEQSFDNIQIRKNLQETAFFFPQLQTDAEGNVSFNFTTPEALTKWKLQLLAHTKTLESATTTLEAVTQKELMVIPNAPRFLRQGDQITISTKIANLTDNQLSGQARLELTDGMTGKSINAKLINSDTIKIIFCGCERKHASFLDFNNSR